MGEIQRGALGPGRASHNMAGLVPRPFLRAVLRAGMGEVQDDSA